MSRMSLALVAIAMLVGGMVGIASPTEAVYDPGWGSATLLEFENFGIAEYVSIVADDEGNAIAVWHQDGGVAMGVWSALYDAGDGWGARERIDNGTLGAGFPCIAIDGRGSAMAIWMQWDAPYLASIWSSRYVVGEGWHTPEPIETEPGHVESPIVSCSPDGDATALWLQSDGVLYNMWSNRYVVGEGWQTAVMIETDDAGDASWGQKVCMDDDGNAVALWCQYSGSSYDLWSNTYEAGVGWGTAGIIESSSFSAHYPDLAMDGECNAIAAWAQDSDVWWNRYEAVSGWGAAELLETEDAGTASLPSVSMTESGDAMAVWSQNDGTRDNIVSKRYVSGVGWGNAQLVETDDSRYAGFAEVATEDDGDAIAVWSQHDGERYNVKSSRYEADIGWGADELIESEDVGNEMDAIMPQVAIGGDGAAFAVWHQNDGILENVWANRYEPYDYTPPPLTVSNPSDGEVVASQSITVSGTTEVTASVDVGGMLVAVDRYGWFSCTIVLAEGSNNIVVTATDEAGNSAVVTRSVTYVDPMTALNDDIDALQGQVDNLSSDLSDVTDELTAVRDELDSANDDVAALESQNSVLMMALVGVIVLACVLLVAYLLLRKKVSKMEGRDTTGGG